MIQFIESEDHFILDVDVEAIRVKFKLALIAYINLMNHSLIWLRDNDRDDLIQAVYISLN